MDVPVGEKTEPKEIIPTEERSKTSESALEAANTDVQPAGSKEKPGFQPVVIVVGKSDKASGPIVEKGEKTELSETQVPAEKEPTDMPVSEKPSETSETIDPTDIEKTGNVRKRVIAGLKINEEIGEKCSIYTSQDSVSILNDGGSLGILVGIDGVESKDIKIANSSPENIGVSLQPDISGIKNRSFFVIRSKSTKTGIYDVVFSGGCGSKTIPVTVR